MVATIFLLVFVVGLIEMLLDYSEPCRNHLLIGGTVFCSLMLTAFIWQVGIFAPYARLLGALTQKRRTGLWRPVRRQRAACRIEERAAFGIRSVIVLGSQLTFGPTPGFPLAALLRKYSFSL